MKYAEGFHPGHALGKYEIVREIATGGMARIYLARVRGTAGFEKNVVLKCILPSLAQDRTFVTMFLDEARLAATLHHSNIADVIDVGVADGTYFFAMEYVNGQNARTVRLRSKEVRIPIPLEVTLAIITATASALEHAHTRSGSHGPLEVVHRDVSPSNILVSYDGAIKLVDFGIARASMRGASKTRTGLRKGKVPYLSPEQCRGQEIDRRTDLFSLGTVLYELATGTRPFRGNSDFEIMESIVECRPAPPSMLAPTLPTKLDDIVFKLLARTPTARYQSAAEVLESLEHLITSKSLRTSAHVVARFMHELYEESPTEQFERDVASDEEQTRLADHRPSRPSRPSRPPTNLADLMHERFDKSEEDPTGAFRKVSAVPPPPPRRASTAPVATDPFSETTREEVVLPFDPIAARSAEILESLDDGAPKKETREARGERRVIALLERAFHYVAIGEPDKAVTAVELALDEGVALSTTHHLLEANVDNIVAVYEALLEDPYRTFTLTRTLPDLADVAMEPRARLLLPWIDGHASLVQVIERSGMQRLEVYHHLCQLLLRGVVR